MLHYKQMITVLCYLVFGVTTILNTPSFSLSLFVSVALISSPSFCVSLFCLRQAVTWSWWRTLKGSQQESPAEREESAATSGSTASSSPPPNRNACSSRPSGTDTRCLATCTRRTGLSTVHTHAQLYVHAGIIKVSLWVSVLIKWSFAFKCFRHFILHAQYRRKNDRIRLLVDNAEWSETGWLDRLDFPQQQLCTACCSHATVWVITLELLNK